METAIKWSPNSSLDDQRFLFADVSGRSLSLGRIKQYDPNNIPKLHYELAPAYRKVPAFRALDWAPFNENLVAVGTPSGETSVLRLDDIGPPISFPAKYQRLCNAVAFTRTGLLATGLERVRNDFCLSIWDVNQRLALRSPVAGPGKSFVEPFRKFASSEAISSIKFFSTQPQVLITGVKGYGIRIYDTRENTGNPSLQYQTPCVHNIALDPHNEKYFACAGPQRDTTIQVWDTRSCLPHVTSNLVMGHGSSLGSGSDQSTQHGPVITYQDVFNNVKTNTKKESSEPTVWSLRYCKGKGGLLGALASNGDFRIFETQQAYIHPEEQQYPIQHNFSSTSISHNHGHITRGFTKRIHQVEQAFDEAQQSRAEKERIVSFDFTNLAGSKGTPCVIFLRGDRSIGIYELNTPASALSFSPSGELAVTKYKVRKIEYRDAIEDAAFLADSVHFVHPIEAESIPAFPSSQRLDLTNTEQCRGAKIRSNRAGFSSREFHEHRHGVPDQVHKLKDEEALALSVISRQRCIKGYLFDCEKNIHIVKDDQWLHNMWAWIHRAKSNATDQSVVWGSLDLSYLGVYRLWNQFLGYQNDSSTQTNYEDAIARLTQKLDLPKLNAINTAFPARRQLCLYTCGLNLKPKQLDDTVKDLVRNGQHTKAAALAVIHDSFEIAASLFKAGDAPSTHRELSLAIAGYDKESTSKTWSGTIENLAVGLEEPYARAILAYVRHGDWHDVLAETTLPLGDRVGIALMYLSDEELSQYVGSALVEAIEYGDLEGIVLTGLTAESVPLFETYVRKYSDLQTAVLALSHASPRYFTDPRVTIWRETYRSHMNTWGMHAQRAQFDVQATKLSTPMKGHPALPPAGRQVSLRCNYCEQPLDRNPRNAPMLEDPNSSFGSHQSFVLGDPKTATICPRCGRHMPRCVVCLHWLGLPDGHGKSRIAAAANALNANGRSKYMSYCHTCLHMSHGDHAQKWFARHTDCPVPGCGCQCQEIDVGARYR
ncbi:MAG: hypothetical protein Q9163_001516 [Psora crenata]